MPADPHPPSNASPYDRLEHRGVYQRQVAEREEEFVVNCLRAHLPQRVLEVGSGTGRFTRHLAQIAKRVVASDIDQEMLDKTRRRVGDADHVSYHAAEFGGWDKLPGYGSFDAAIAMRVIPHCHDWQAALRTVADAVRPGGLLIFDLWNRNSFVAWLLRRQQHDDWELVHRLTPGEIRTAVDALPGKTISTLRWGYPRLGPLACDDLFALLLPSRAYSTTFCVQVERNG